MRTIDLTTTQPSVKELLELAQESNLLIRDSNGKTFAITEVQEEDSGADFGVEIALTRQNAALMALLEEREGEKATLTPAQVRQQLGLSSPTQ